MKRILRIGALLLVLLAQSFLCTLCLADFPPSFMEAHLVNDCGHVSLQVCANYHGLSAGKHEIRSILPATGEMVSFAEISDAASSLGLYTLAVQWAEMPEHLVSAPAILPITVLGKPHFAVAAGNNDNRVLIVDVPNAGWVDLHELREKYHWSGQALHVARTKGALMPLYWKINHRHVVAIIIVVTVLIFLIFRLRKIFRRSESQTANTQCTILTSVIFILSMNIGCGAASTSSDGSPEIESGLADLLTLSPRELVLTNDDSNTSSSATLTLKSMCPKPVRILSIQPSCGCTVASKPSHSIISTGEESAISLDFQIPKVGEKSSRVVVEVESNGEIARLSSNIELHGQTPPVPSVKDFPSVVNAYRTHSGSAAGHFRLSCFETFDQLPWIANVSSSDHVKVTIDRVSTDSYDKNLMVRTYDCSFDVPLATDTMYPMVVNATDGSAVRQVRLIVGEWNPLILTPAILTIEPGQSKTIRGVWIDKSVKLSGLTISTSDNSLDAKIQSIDLINQKFDVSVTCSDTKPAGIKNSSAATVVTVECEFSKSPLIYAKEIRVTSID